MASDTHERARRALDTLGKSGGGAGRMCAPLAALRLDERERTHGADRPLTARNKIDALRVGGVVGTVAEARALLIEMGELPSAKPNVVTTDERARQEALDRGDDPALADEIAAMVADQCDELGCS
jgi:hypothetical protein